MGSVITEEQYRILSNGQVIQKDTRVTKSKKSKKGEDYPDDFIMLYVRFIGALNRVPATANPILNALLRRVSPAYNGQAIVLNGTEIKRILQETGIKKSAFYENMKLLVEYQVIFPTYEDKAHTKWGYCSTFYLNPYMFGFGNWTDIKNLRSRIEINEQGLQLLTETSSEPSLPSLTPGEQQRLFRIDGDYFGLDKKIEEENRQKQAEVFAKQMLAAVAEQDANLTPISSDEAHRAESSSADQSEADSEFEILDDVSITPKTGFISGLGSSTVQAFGAEWKGKVLQFKNREQRDAFLRSRKK